MTLRMLVLSLTTRCNLACRYCYAGCSPYGIDMSRDVIERALDMIVPGVPCHIQMTGGEPTLVPELIELTADMARRGGRDVSLAVQTNATLLTSDLVHLFKTRGIQVGVSLDGPPDIQQKLRGRAADTLKGLHLLDAMDVPFRATTVVSQVNAARLHELVLLLAGFRQSLGVGLDLLVGKGRAGETNGPSPATPEAIREGVGRMAGTLDMVNARRNIPLRLRELELVRDASRRSEKRTFCYACRNESLAVHPDGRIFPCSQTMGDERFTAGDVWKPDHERLKALAGRTLDGDQCLNCGLAQSCPGECPSRLFYNSPNKSLLICEVYQTLWRTMNAAAEIYYKDVNGFGF